MASEIIVTFEDGAIFNGFANSYTKDDKTFFYFEIDKKYRVQVLNNGESITLQQYKNTNGSWYNINIIKSVEIKTISGGGSGDVTIEYLKQNYYSKQETDDRYVKKTGDTMSGNLIVANNDYKTVISPESVTIMLAPDKKPLLQAYRNNLNLYKEGGLYIKVDSYGSTIYSQLTSNGLSINNSSGGTVGYFLQESNREKTAIHLFNDSRIVMHSGQPATTEAFLQFKYNTFTSYNDYAKPLTFECATAFENRVDLLAWMYIRDKVSGIVNGIIYNNGNWNLYNKNNIVTHIGTYENPQGYIAIGGTTVSGHEITFENQAKFTNKILAQSNITCYDYIDVTPNSGSGGNTKITAGNITVYSSLNNENTSRVQLSGTFINVRKDYSGTLVNIYSQGVKIETSGQKKTELTPSRFDTYYGGGVYIHSGAPNTTEQFVQYTYNAITCFNVNLGTFTINSNGAALLLQSLAAGTAARINTPNGHYSLTEQAGTATGTGIYTACNNTFYGESMLNALNEVLSIIMTNIGITSYVTFEGSSFVAGGGSSRGGGVGRR